MTVSGGWGVISTWNEKCTDGMIIFRSLDDLRCCSFMWRLMPVWCCTGDRQCCHIGGGVRETMYPRAVHTRAACCKALLYRMSGKHIDTS